MRYIDFIDIVLITLLTILVLGSVVGVLWAAAGGVTKAERVECAKWTEQAKEFPETYFVTEWQVEMCEAIDRPLPDGFLRAK